MATMNDDNKDETNVYTYNNDTNNIYTLHIHAQS